MSMMLDRQTAAEPVANSAGSPPPAAQAPPSRRLTWTQVRTTFLIALPVLCLVYVCLIATGVHSQIAVRGPSSVEPIADLPEPNGIRLYAENCARCHGSRGTADGSTSPYLDPPARRFGEDKFMLTSTANGIPTDDDLMYVLRHGIPGTAMPPFERLSEAECRALVAHIRWLTRAGTYARLYQRAKKQEPDDTPDVAELSAAAAKQAIPGEVVQAPAELPAPDDASLARGQKFFTAMCATCHGPKGAGDGTQIMKKDNGEPTKPRDLARGIFKGGGEPERLYVRIAVGMPGTPMPGSTTLKPHEIGDLVNFVRSLSPSSPPDPVPPPVPGS
jgi:mono/diheme cytochrome c family protein